MSHETNNPKELHSLKAKMIKDNLTWTLLELGTGETLAMIEEICHKIAKEGGAEVQRLGVNFPADAWERTAWEIERIKGLTHT